MSNGSSPRVRGKQPRAVRAVGRCRLIPARAGKTRRVGHPRPPSPAHPRACGENKCMSLQSTRSVGSSPRVRGKRTAPEGGLPRCRLIPARAGKTGCSPRARAPCEAHPRACGENCGRGIKRVFPPGSSPRVRGKRCRPWGWAWGFRLIPARAGKTRKRRRPRSSYRAHPRACGENRSGSARPGRNTGSSPRVRGKLGEGQSGDRQAGLIPARAGKTRTCSSGNAGSAAHPRACGENSLATFAQKHHAGSSPRVRGKLGEGQSGDRQAGLIPARAGKTRTCSSGNAGSAAHPRACGENSLATFAQKHHAGSSPRVRGKLD